MQRRWGNGNMTKVNGTPIGNHRPAASVERRRKPRIFDPIFVLVRGSDGSGHSFQFNTIARNIGSGGLYAYTPQVMEVGQKLMLYIRFARAGSKPLEAPAVAARAVVRRIEQQFNGSYLFAASFLLYRFV